MDDEPLEPAIIDSVQCDGLSTVHVDKAGVARIDLYAEQLETDGTMYRVLVSRLRMSREIADRMLTASMVAAQAEPQAVKEWRRDAH